jgi:hypothetical protein
MATRGQIAYLANPNTIYSIYIHYDAYPEALGKTLNTIFNSEEDAEMLVTDRYDIRFIDDDGTVDRFDRGGYKVIINEDPEELFSNLYSHSNRAAANYVYVWLEDKWVTLDMNKGRQYFVGTLLDSIRKTEPTMNEAYKDATDNELASYIGTLQNQIGAEKDPKKSAMLKQDLEDVKSELEKRKSTNKSQEENLFEEEYQKRKWLYRAGIIK